MNHFQPKGGVLHAEGIPVPELAAAYGTPLYLYSTATLTRHWKVLNRSLSGLRRLVCYALKANSNLAVVSLFARLGSGFDIVSGGELYRVLHAGGDPRRVVYSGVGKRDGEISFALHQKVKVLNVESGPELSRVSVVARRMKLRAPVALRVNPDVDPKTHPYIATGLKETKFGVSVEEARRLYHLAAQDPAIEVRGIACHIGSQITALPPFVDAVARLRELARDLRRQGMQIRHIDVGGGLGIRYLDEEPPHPEDYGRAVKRALRGFQGEVILEPGRVLVGNAGVLVTRVLYVKHHGRKVFAVVDAAMNDLLRPSLYGAEHAIEPVVAPRPGTREVECDVVGPICESADFLAKRRRLQEPQPGDLLCIRSTGAYGFAMSSNYNARPRAAEVLVDRDQALLARQRETLRDLIRGERPTPRSRRFAAGSRRVQAIRKPLT